MKYQVQHMHNGNPRRRGERGQKEYEEIMDENFSHMMKNVNPHTQEGP